MGVKFSINGEVFSGSSIDSIRKYVENTQPFEYATSAGFLPEGEKVVGFWERVFQLNMQRKYCGQRWIFPKLISYLKHTHKIENPEDIFHYIDEHPGEHSSMNKPEKIVFTDISKRGCGKCERGYIYKLNAFGEVVGTPCACNVSEYE